MGLGYTGLLVNDLEAAAPFYHFSFLLVACGVLLEFLKLSFHSDRMAVLGFVLLMTVPLCLRVGIEPLADHGLMLYFLTAVVLALVAAEPFGEITTHLLAGAAFGLAASTKYNGTLAMAAFVPVALLIWSRSPNRTGRSLWQLLLTYAVAGILFVPWLFRNYRWTGNPFFPFLQKWFSSSGRNIAFGGDTSPILYRVEVYGDSLLQTLLVPLRFFFYGADGNPKYFDGVLSPVLLLAFGVVLVKKKPSWVNPLPLLPVLHCISSLFLFYALVRYQLPVIAIMALLAAIVLEYCAAANTKAKTFAYCCLAVHLALALTYSGAIALEKSRWLYLKGRASRTAYLQHNLGDVRMIHWINDNLTPQDKIYLVLTGNRFYYYDVPVESRYFSFDKVAGWIEASRSTAELFRRIDSEGYTHLLLHVPRSVRMLNELKREKLSLWQSFTRHHLQLLHTDGPYILYRLTVATADAPPRLVK